VRWVDTSWLARIYRRGKRPDRYPRLLAERLLNPACEAGAKLPREVIEMLKALLADLIARRDAN
jgi:hypothetical protein